MGFDECRGLAGGTISFPQNIELKSVYSEASLGEFLETKGHH